MKKHSLSRLFVVLLMVNFICLGLCGSAWAKKEIVLDFVSFIPVKMFEFSRWKTEFIDKVNDRAKGELKLRVRGGPEAIPQFDQAMAVKKGLVHIMYSPSGFFTSVVPGIDCIRLSEFTAQEERENGAFEVISEMCENAGFKYLGRALTANQGIFWLFTNKKAQKPEDFKGMKIGASPSFHGYIKGLGAANVTVQISEYYNAMERGVVDAHTASLGVWMGIGAYEVTQYVLDEPYYATNSPILVNLKKWNSLPEHLQNVLWQAAVEQEKAWPAIRDAEEARIKGVAEKAGVEFYKLPPEVRKWYYHSTYDTAWEEDAKRFPPEIVNKLKAVLKKS